MLTMLGVTAVSGILGILGVFGLLAAAYAVSRGQESSTLFGFSFACLFGWAVLAVLIRIHDEIADKHKAADG